MNGVLWKWTNYYSGWQSRWFVLKDGILSYYRSEDEVQSGSKGSINLAVCDLNVSNIDQTRFEIVIPGEQKYHLKSSSIQDRQRWIVAIGSCKACHTEPEFEIIANSSLSTSLPTNEISSKESEMRLYMELMNQQVLLLKNQLSENQCPDMTVINDLTSTLNAASDTFLASLKDLMAIIALNTIALVDSPPAYGGSPTLSFKNSNNETDHKIRRHSNIQSNSRFNNGFPPYRTRKSMSQETHISSEPANLENRRKANFFIQMVHSFADWGKLVESCHTISTENYINSFLSLLHFLDYFDTSPIVSLKLDIIAQVKRLSQKFEADKDKFSTLESILKSESSHSAQLNVESAAYVIRSLNRCMMFVEHFLQYFHHWISIDRSNDYDEQTVLKTLLTRAYDNSLGTKMNWIDQGLFTIIIRSLPPLSEFLCHLLGRYSETDKSVGGILNEFSDNVDQLLVDMNTYRKNVAIINCCLIQFLSDVGIEL